MQVIKRMSRSLSKPAALLALGCLAFSSALSAQTTKGFFVYPDPSPKAKNSAVLTAAVECEKFNIKAKKDQKLTCTFKPVQARSEPYATDGPPSVLVFNNVKPLFCYWDPMRQTWVCF